MKTVGIIAGTEADVRTLQGLGLEIASGDAVPAAIKIGKLGSAEEITSTISFLKNY